MYILAVTAAVLSLLVGVSTGSLSIPFSSIVRILAAEWFGAALPRHIPADWVPIVMAIRLPRVVLAFWSGRHWRWPGPRFKGC